MATGRQLTERELAIVGKYSAQHGQVRPLEQSIADVNGAIGAPLLRLSTLQRLERRGAISRAEAEAGERFHALFQNAGLDGLRAADLARAPASGGAQSGNIPPSHERCRVRVAEAMAALGGNASCCASAAWHCIGLEWTVRRWSLTARRSREECCGILVGALAVLAAHFTGRRRSA